MTIEQEIMELAALPPLDDKTIRQALLQKLASRSPKAIIEELYVHRGNAIADVVSIHSEAHCYEIKGEGDNIQRILTQVWSEPLGLDQG